MARYKMVDMSPRLLPVDLEAQLVPGTFAHAVHHVVDALDLSAFDAHYRSDEVGASAHAPSMLLNAVLLAYSQGVVSSRAIERACRDNVLFITLTGDAKPHFTTIADFVSRSYPNHTWVADITYIATDEGWLYLAVVLDLYSRKVVGWSMSARMTATVVCDALRMALFARKMPRGVILHSDRRSQYCSREHRKLLDHHGLVASMSARGNCYDNAMESWNHSLKVEAIHGERFATRELATAHVFEYIEVDYNRSRLHSTLGYLSPGQFELTHAA